jgi:hypothetical protein
MTPVISKNENCHFSQKADYTQFLKIKQKEFVGL